MKKKWTASDRLSDTPEEIISKEVFPRLQAKSFYRLASVSKHFLTLTSNRPPILDDAFRRRAGGRYVISFETAVNKLTVFYYSDPERQSKIDDTRTLPDLYIYLKFINGLVCLVQANHAVIIRNPATEQEIQLPLLPTDYPYVLMKIFTYFCYHPGSNRYKVLRSYVGNLEIEMGFSVFSLGADQSWRNLSDPDLQQAGNSSSVCVNGVLYCTNFMSKTIEGGVIAAFDVGSERFSSVEYPKGLPPERYSSCHLIEAGGLIRVLDSKDILVSGIIRMWTMSPESWVEHRIEVPSAVVETFHMGPSLSFTSNVDGEMVVAMAGMSSVGCWVYRYNIETGWWRRIKMAGMQVQCIFGYFQIDEYVETPLLLSHILNSSVC